MKRKMENRSTYKWWKGLYDVVKTGSQSAVMDYVYARLDRGSFRSQRNAAFNEDAIAYILKEAKRTPTALEYAQKEVKKWEKS